MAARGARNETRVNVRLNEPLVNCEKSEPRGQRVGLLPCIFWLSSALRRRKLCRNSNSLNFDVDIRYVSRCQETWDITILRFGNGVEQGPSCIYLKIG